MGIQQKTHPSLPALELGGRKRREERACDTGAPAHRAETTPGPVRSQAGESSDGGGAARDDDILAPFGAFDEPRQMGLGRVNRMNLGHSRDLS